MPKLNLTVSELSILMSLALGLWEFYFFFFGGRWEGPLGWFTPDRLGFNVAWLAVVYIPSSCSRSHSRCADLKIGSSASWTGYRR